MESRFGQRERPATVPLLEGREANGLSSGPRTGALYSPLVSARVRPLLFIIGLILAVWVLRAVEAGAPQEWVTPQEVLVLFNARWPDEDGNYRSDSQDVAEYYAARRASRGSTCWAWP
jgi:hypothetical protein